MQHVSRLPHCLDPANDVDFGLDNLLWGHLQVAINWCMAQGTVPIPGAKNLAQASDNANTRTASMLHSAGQ
jgi:hypothetical protein